MGYEALGDRRTYAAAMLLVAAMNLTSIVLVLVYFRRRRAEAVEVGSGVKVVEKGAVAV